MEGEKERGMGVKGSGRMEIHGGSLPMSSLLVTASALREGMECVCVCACWCVCVCMCMLVCVYV